MTNQTDIDALAVELRGFADAWDAPVSPPITVTLRAAASALESTAAELRQERERAENGSCWDEGPTLGTPDGCNPMPPRCELRAGHAGAHRSGHTEWMRNSSLRQVETERDEARDELARAQEVIEKAREATGPNVIYSPGEGEGWGAEEDAYMEGADHVLGIVRAILATYEKGQQS